jgi:hypothetical protein
MPVRLPITLRHGSKRARLEGQEQLEQQSVMTNDESGKRVEIAMTAR